MKIILFQLITNLTIGSKVFFDDKVQTVVDFQIVTPFTKGLLKTKWSRPFNIILTLKNEWGYLDYVGYRAIKNIYEVGLPMDKIRQSL